MSNDEEQGDEGDRPKMEHLLQGRDAWWHFLEAKGRGEQPSPAPIEILEGGDEDEIELEMVGRLAERAERDRQPAFKLHTTVSARCRHCLAQVPGDLPMCLCCAESAPRIGTRRRYLIVIGELESVALVDEIAGLISASNDSLHEREIESALRQPPAIFTFHSHFVPAQALVERLGEMGAVARLDLEDETDESIGREVFEAMARRPRIMALWVASVLASIALGVITSWFASALCIALASAILIVYQTSSFGRRYAIGVDPILSSLTGFDEEMMHKTQRVFDALDDPQIARLVTACLMEVYAIWRQLSAAPPQMRAMGSELKQHLHALTHRLLDQCERYAQLDAYASHLGSQGLQALEQESSASNSVLRAEAAGRDRRTTQELDRALGALTEHLHETWARLESMRARVVSTTLKERIEPDESLRDSLVEFDHEITIFEEAMEEVERLTSARSVDAGS